MDNSTDGTPFQRTEEIDSPISTFPSENPYESVDPVRLDEGEKEREEGEEEEVEGWEDHWDRHWDDEYDSEYWTESDQEHVARAIDTYLEGVVFEYSEEVVPPEHMPPESDTPPQERAEPSTPGPSKPKKRTWGLPLYTESGELQWSKKTQMNRTPLNFRNQRKTEADRIMVHFATLLFEDEDGDKTEVKDRFMGAFKAWHREFIKNNWVRRKMQC